MALAAGDLVFRSSGMLLFCGILSPKENVDEFIEAYEHIYYCEILIEPDGGIRRCIPSHQETLKMLCEPLYPDVDDVWDVIPLDCPFEWMLDRTGCVAVWYDFIKVGPGTQITPEQKACLGKLQAAGKIKLTGTQIF